MSGNLRKIQCFHLPACMARGQSLNRSKQLGDSGSFQILLLEDWVLAVCPSIVPGGTCGRFLPLPGPSTATYSVGEDENVLLSALLCQRTGVGCLPLLLESRKATLFCLCPAMILARSNFKCYRYGGPEALTDSCNQDQLQG